jgi:hypothetical protein
MAEAAIALPAVLLVLFFGWNVSQAAMTSMAARQAADYAVRVASVARYNPEHWAKESAKASLLQSGAKGTFDEAVVELIPGAGGNTILRVTLAWHHPTILTGLCNAVNRLCASEFTGRAVATAKWEGW